MNTPDNFSVVIASIATMAKTLITLLTQELKQVFRKKYTKLMLSRKSCLKVC